MNIQIINGPNLNLLGKRETGIYGKTDFLDYFEYLQKTYPMLNLHYYHSNLEGDLINILHETGFSMDGIIMNAGAYSHTSIAIADAVAAIKTPVVEVHISNLYAREEFRHYSLISKNARGIITGMGLHGYELAIVYITTLLNRFSE